jgi:uncharacterized protein YjbI with pentapeptide repeats
MNERYGEQYLFGAPLRSAVAILLDGLWLPDQTRLTALLELSTAPEISLAECLEALFPDKARESALTEFRNFRKRVNDLAARKGVALRCVVDQNKRSAPGERSCWFTGATSERIEPAAHSRAASDLTPAMLDFLSRLLAGSRGTVPPLPLGENRGEGRASAGPRPHRDPLPKGEGTSTAIQALNTILASASLPAATLAFRYWLHAIAQGLPEPAPGHVNLAGADLDGWTIRGRSPDQPLRLRGANLEGARLNGARFENVDLTTASLKRAEAREALFLNVTAAHADLTRSDLCDLKWRVGSLAEARLSEAQISGTHWIDVDLTGALLPENWERDAVFVDRARMESRPTVPQRAAQLVALAASAANVTACGFSPDGRVIVSGSNDGTLRIWETETGTCLRALAAHAHPVTLCRFSVDGRQIISGARTGLPKVWDSASGECLKTEPRQNVAAAMSAVSPDGRKTASPSDDGTSVTVRDGATGACLWSGFHFPDAQSAALDLVHNRILSASPEAWRFLGWRAPDPATGHSRLLPAEFFGPLPR